MGWVFAGVNFHVADSRDQFAALATRLFFETSEPVLEEWDGFNKFFKIVYPKGLWPDGFERMTNEDYLARYTGAQLRALQDAYQSLSVRGLMEADCSSTAMFVKREVRNWAWFIMTGVLELVKPRVINSCSPRGKMAAGPDTVALTEQLKVQWSQDDAIFFECGSTQDIVADWFNRGLKKYGVSWLLESDVSKMDRCQNVYSLGFCADQMIKAGCGPYCKKFVLGQLKRQTIYSRHGIKAEVDPYLKSGVPMTTLWNSIVNALMQQYSFWKAGAKPFVDYVIMVRGDDSLAFVRPGMEKELVTTCKRLGFKIKAKRPARIQDVRFCSNAFYPTAEGGYVPAPTIKCLTKLCATVTTVTKKTWRAHMRGVALGLLALTNHVPLLSDYVQMVLRNTEGASGKVMANAVAAAKKKYFKGSKHEKAACSDEYFASMYDATSADIQAVRDLVSEMKEPGVYGSPVTIQFFSRALTIEAG